ncbi:MAG: hypothetical protein ACLSHM_06380 [Vescimonas sp.]
MSLFSKKPKSIADFEKEIEKLRHKKKLSARNSERLEEYEKQLSSLKTAEEAAQKKESTAKENCHWLYRSFSGAHHLYYHSRMYF